MPKGWNNAIGQEWGEWEGVRSSRGAAQVIFTNGGVWVWVEEPETLRETQVALSGPETAELAAAARRAAAELRSECPEDWDEWQGPDTLSGDGYAQLWHWGGEVLLAAGHSGRDSAVVQLLADELDVFAEFLEHAARDASARS